MTEISYGEFGRRFFHLAVTEERVLGAVDGLAGRPIDFGPSSVGPGRLIKVRANGSVGEPTVTRTDGEPLTFTIGIPITLTLVIEITLDKHRYDATLLARLHATARALEPLKIFIDVDPPDPASIELDLQADGLRATFVQAVGNVENELRRTVAKVIGKEIEKGKEKRVIDVERSLAKMGTKSERRPRPQ